MNKLYVICPGKLSTHLSTMMHQSISDFSYSIICSTKNLPDLTNKKILFIIEVDALGLSLPIMEVISKLYDRGNTALLGSSAAILVHSSNDLYTKNAARDIIFLTNQLGCRFIGHPLVEATGSLNTFLTWKKKLNLSLEEICYILCKKLVYKLMNDQPDILKSPKILALHSSSHKTSNTLLLWEIIKEHLAGYSIEQLHVENGTVLDCIGCSFKTCKHYSKHNSCFYGGFMVEEIYPAIEKADAIFWICPNYNDAISANLTAVINRLTSLYRRTPFYNKTLFSIIVSGNSGSDIVAKQLIAALNINKGFRLPPYFALMCTANDPESILKVTDLDKKVATFSQNIMKEIKA
ncbi:NAD(P)H-dependent oxidoreductase [Lutibacter sp. B2]|nr:NAD(P)H-dependent oxidoreductase [Lutibacter sp. B2]